MSTLRWSQLSWYARRLSRMEPWELAWRARDEALHLAWSRRQVDGRRLGNSRVPTVRERQLGVLLSPETAARVPAAARDAVLDAADTLMRGEWELLGVTRTDLAQPDWFLDPVTGRRAPAGQYAFRINYRREEVTGNVKQVWELSRLQHLTLLATAWFVSGEEAYAQRVADQLGSWWRENPFLSGVHWTSGIEIGIRLISLTWIRRLLNDWPKASELFEQNDLAVTQICWHQQYLAAFRSRGSSANNHVIAEAAGQLVASCAFPWYPASDRWRRASKRLLERELMRNTFPSGIGREMAMDYQLFIAELGLVAATEAAAHGSPLNAIAWQRLCAIIDSGAALLDQQLRPPRQGDGDQGRALLLDAPVANRWASLLALAEVWFGRLDWWPRVPGDAGSSIVSGIAEGRREVPGRPPRRPWRFPEAGISLLRAADAPEPEIWCRCDGGPHGYLGIAAHAHADALSIEVRYGGADILADPGTYCYHGDSEFRSYFRSTIGHNTVELDGRSQSQPGGDFLWLRHADARELRVSDSGHIVEWAAEHYGYSSRLHKARHRRFVRLDRQARAIKITDVVDPGHNVRLVYHFGPELELTLKAFTADLQWLMGSIVRSAALFLPGGLNWTAHRGETDPIIGWYSSEFGRRKPAWSIVGSGQSGEAQVYETELRFAASNES